MSMFSLKKENEENNELYQGYKKDKEKFRLVEPGDEPAEDIFEPEEIDEATDNKRKNYMITAIGIGAAALIAILLIGTNSTVKRMVFGTHKTIVSEQNTAIPTQEETGDDVIAASDPKADIRTDIVTAGGKRIVDAEGKEISAEELETLINTQIKESVQTSIEEADINGADGAPGEDGAPGMDGAAGVQGERGEKGETGAVGAQGEKGEKGETGAAGAQGERGEKGETGATGAQGERGKDGKSVYDLAKESGYTGTEAELSQLLSTLKNSIDGINTEMTNVKGDVSTLNSKIVDMNAKVSECFQSVSDGKALVASTITDKGVTTAPDATFEVINKNIAELYIKAFQDGVDSISGKTPNVEYEYHYHTGSASAGGGCYTSPQYHVHNSGCAQHGTLTATGTYDYVRISCNFCGHKFGDSGNNIPDENDAGVEQWMIDMYNQVRSAYHNSDKSGPASVTRPCSCSRVVCGKENNTQEGWSTSCGYSDGQIISAKIVF